MFEYIVLFLIMGSSTVINGSEKGSSKKASIVPILCCPIHRQNFSQRSGSLLTNVNVHLEVNLLVTCSAIKVCTAALYNSEHF